MKNDATARWEAMVDEVTEGLDEWAGRVMQAVLPRPPGAEPLTPEESHERWLAIKDDPEAAGRLLQQRAQVLGPVRAALELLLWDKKHRAMEEGRDGHKEEGGRAEEGNPAAEEGAEAHSLP